METKRLKKTPKVKGSSEFTRNFLKHSKKKNQQTVIDSIREDIGSIRDELLDFDLLVAKLSGIIDIINDLNKTVNGIEAAIDNIEQRVDEIEE